MVQTQGDQAARILMGPAGGPRRAAQEAQPAAASSALGAGHGTQCTNRPNCCTRVVAHASGRPASAQTPGLGKGTTVGRTEDGKRRRRLTIMPWLILLYTSGRADTPAKGTPEAMPLAKSSRSGCASVRCWWPHHSPVRATPHCTCAAGKAGRPCTGVRDGRVVVEGGTGHASVRAHSRCRAGAPAFFRACGSRGAAATPGAHPPTHLVKDQQHAVPVAQLAQAGEEAGGRGEEAALPQDGLDDDGRRLLQRRASGGRCRGARLSISRRTVSGGHTRCARGAAATCHTLVQTSGLAWPDLAWPGLQGGPPLTEGAVCILSIQSNAS